MSKPVPNWLLNLWFGDNSPKSYGILSPAEPTQAIGRVTRQQRRHEVRKGLTGSRC